MTSLPEISLDQWRNEKDIEGVFLNSGGQANVLYQSIPLMSNAVLNASRIADKLCPQNYNSNIPASRQQGVLSAVSDLQQRITAFTGYPSVSLAAHSCRMAIFSSLSMILEYHKKNNQQRSHVVLMRGRDDVADVANELSLGVTFSDPENITDYLNDECAALVVSLPGIDSNINCLESVRGKLDQLDIPVYLDGSGQYLWAKNKALEWLKADVLHLDVGHICGLERGSNAVLSNSTFSDYLPVPMAGNNDGAYQWKTLSDNPLSIGMLSDTPIDLPAALHCLSYFRMQGFAAIHQQAIQSMILARNIGYQLNSAGIKTEDISEASGRCVIVIGSEMAGNESMDQLLVGLSELPIRLQIQSQNETIKVILANLHQLNFDQLHRLIEMFILHHQNSELQ